MNVKISLDFVRRGAAAVILLGLALCVSTAQAKVISINLDGEGLDQNELLAPGDVAGVVPAANWNNVTGPFVYNGTTFLGTINDDSGAGTGVTFASRGGGPNNTETVVGSDANAKMMTGRGPRTFIDPPNSTDGGFNYWAQAQFQNLNAEFSGGYDVYVYYGAGYGGFMGGWGDLVATNTGFLASAPATTDPGAQVNTPGPASPVGAPIASVPYTTLMGTSAGLNAPNTYNPTDGFVLSTGANPASGGNYVVLEDLTEDTLVLSMVGAYISSGNLQWNSNTILGIQIVGNAPVPEPSSFALAGLGLLGLVGFGLRRRKKQRQ